MKTIQPATEAAARRVCGGAIVGSGHVTLQAHIPTQPSFEVKAKLLAFNGPRKNGHKLILAQAYARKPPGGLHPHLPGQSARRPLRHRDEHDPAPGRAEMGLPHPLRHDSAPRLPYRGQRHSYISAACLAPAGFDTALFPFARATYDFANGQKLHDDGGAELHRGAVGVPRDIRSAKLDAYRAPVIIKRT